MKNNSYEKEAEILGRYILKIPISNKAIDIYTNYLNIIDLPYSIEEKILVDKCISNPKIISYYDAGLSLQNKNHLLKRKLLIMFAILECQPEYSNYFLSKNFSKLYLLKIIFIGIKAVFIGILGYIIVTLNKIK